MPQKNTEEHGRAQRHGLPLLLPGTVWLPSPGASTFFVASHFFAAEPRVRELDAIHVAVLERCTGEHAPAVIAGAIGASREAVDGCLEWWRREAPAALLFRPPDVDMARALRARSAAKDILADSRTAQSTSRSTADFHRERLTDPHRNFERHETTICYVLSEPHPALHGQRYGERIADRLIAAGLPHGARILEIGPGLGLLAAAFLDRMAEAAPGIYSRLSYTLLDISPPLVTAQTKALGAHARRTQWIEGDAETAALPSLSFDAILCNEVIADLSVEFADRDRIEAGRPVNDAERAVLDYDLAYGGAPPRFVVNLGAIALLERISRWLAPGGRAWITEYGAPHTFPRAVELPGHVEYSIRFDHLLKVAAQLGLEAGCSSLADWLQIDETVEVMDADDGTAAAELLMPCVGLPQPARPWLVTRERLREWLGDAASRLGHRGFVPLDAPQIGFAPSKFLALTVFRRGASRGPSPAGPMPA